MFTKAKYLPKHYLIMARQNIFQLILLVVQLMLNFKILKKAAA